MGYGQGISDVTVASLGGMACGGLPEEQGALGSMVMAFGHSLAAVKGATQVPSSGLCVMKVSDLYSSCEGPL